MSIERIPFSECCSVTSDEFPFTYQYSINEGLTNFIAPYCAPCPLELQSVWSHYLPSGEVGVAVCSSMFIFGLIFAILTLIFYVIFAVQRAIKGKIDVGFFVSLASIMISLCQLIGAALGLSGSWCDGTSAIRAYRQLRGFSVLGVFLVITLQAFWYASMTSTNLKSVGKVSALKIPLSIVIVIISFIAVVLEPNSSLFLDPSFGATFAGPSVARSITGITVVVFTFLLACLLAFYVSKVTKNISSEAAGGGSEWRLAALRRITTTSTIILGTILLYGFAIALQFSYHFFTPSARFDIAAGSFALYYFPQIAIHLPCIVTLYPFLAKGRKTGGSGATSSTDSLADSLLSDDTGDASSDSSSSSSSSSSDSADSGATSVELSEI